MTTTQDVLSVTRSTLFAVFGEDWWSNREARNLLDYCQQQLQRNPPDHVREDVLKMIEAKRAARNGDGW